MITKELFQVKLEERAQKRQKGRMEEKKVYIMLPVLIALVKNPKK